MSEKSQEQNTAKEKLDEFKNMSSEERKEMAKEIANKAKDMAKEKLDELKNMSAEERKEIAKKVAEDAKEMANKTKDIAKEKLDEFKNMSAEERKEMAKNKMEDLKKMPLKNKLISGAVAATILVFFISIFSSDVHASPDTVAKTACQAMADNDYDAFAELFKPSDKQFMNADNGARELFTMFYKEEHGKIDCSSMIDKELGNDRMIFQPKKGNFITVYRYKDGKWYVGL